MTMNKAAIWGLLALFYCLDSWGATWYARAGGSGDGTSYANAWSLSGVTWGVSGVNTGDTLKVCGSFAAADKDSSKGGAAMLSVEQSGVIVDGDCSSDGGTSQAILDGENTVIYGMYCDTAAECQDQTWKNILVKRTTTRGHYVRNGATVADVVNFTGTNLDCEDITSASDNAQWCIAGFANTATFSGVNSTNTKDDSVHWEGSNFTITDSVLLYPGKDGTNIGDCVQVITETDNAVIRRNYCDKRTTTGDGNMAKSCWIIGDPATGTSGEISDNECYLPTTGNATWQSKPILVSTAVTGVKIRRNYVYGGYYGIFVFGADALVESNVVVNSEFRGIEIPTVTGAGTTNVRNNTVSGSPICYILKGAAATTNIFAYNNLAMNCSTYGYEKVTATYTQSNNRCDTVTPTCSNNAGTISSVAPGLIGGSAPTSVEGFRLSGNSALRRAGLELNLGNIQDVDNRAFSHPPSIGAWEAASGDIATARTAASTRSARQ